MDALVMLAVACAVLWPWALLHGAAKWIVGVPWVLLVVIPVTCGKVAEIRGRKAPKGARRR